LNTLCRVAFLAFSLMASSVWGFANGAPLGVVYPELREPYKKIFETIIGGIESEIGRPIDKYSLSKSFDSIRLQSEIENHGNQVVLALGLRGVKAIRQTGLDIPVVVGAVLSTRIEQQTLSTVGISLVPDPNILFKKLKLFAPSIKTVSVVYNPDNNQKLIEQAKRWAMNLGIKLDAREARDLRAAALVYRELSATIDSTTNAIWLMQDRTTMDSDSILPSLLEEAWRRRLIVFSSKLVHAKRGALFSMYPDNFKMGQELGKLAQSIESRSIRSGVEVLRTLKTAVNMRTAKHLGIDLLAREGKSFDLVFPMQ